MLLNILKVKDNPPTTKFYPAPNVKSAEVEKPCLKDAHLLGEQQE